MQNLFNNVKTAGLKVAEMVTPVLKESKFLESGVITPEEFVAAGDHLVHTCPTWSWCSGDEKYTKPYLPKDKQFLVTKNVPCYKRCSHLMDQHQQDQEKLVEADEEGGDNDGGWVDTHHYDSKEKKDGGEAALDMDEPAPKDNPPPPPVVQPQEDSDEEALDMEDFEESGMMDDQVLTVEQPNKGATTDSVEGASPEILATRTYDLMITYDKYYQTPRLWLTGYDESRKPLTMDQMFEDFSADHANKTVTMESHPHLGDTPPQASVHPCNHASVMKKILDTISEGGNELGVHMYILVFLKFVQSVIPTVEYDFTQNISLSG